MVKEDVWNAIKVPVIGKQIVRKEIARSFPHKTLRMSVRKKLHTKIDNTISHQNV